MNLLRTIIDKTWEKFLALCGALCVLLPTSPLNMTSTFRDSGVFLYIGWRILNGELPYRDIWDHKPPVIFYINALGLAITDNSRWGVWLVELAALFIAAFLGYLLIKKIFGVLPAVLSLLFWLVSLVPLLQGGNFATEYTLPLQVAVLWLFYHANTSKHPNRFFFFIGLAGAIAFLTKQTTIGIWLAIGIYLTARGIFTKQFRRWAGETAFISLGGLLFTALTVLFFGIQGALPQFWEAAFEYNFAYAARLSMDAPEWLGELSKGLRPLIRTGILQVAVGGIVFAVFFPVFRKGVLRGETLPLLSIGLINLPIELALIGLPGATFPHYHITLLPSLALLTGLFFYGILPVAPAFNAASLLKYALAFIISGYFIWGSMYIYMDHLYTYRKLSRNEAVTQFVKEHTDPEDQVLVWGAETSVNYFTGRKSPTRFVYQYPLHRTGYVTENMINEFLDDVIQNQPRLILDTGTQNPFFEFPITSHEIKEKTAYLQSHYCARQRIDKWTVYEFFINGCND